MAMAGVVPTTKIEALAHELRLLKSGMADVQGRLDALLSEVDGELQGTQVESEPAMAEAADGDAAPATEPDLFSLSVDVATPAEPIAETPSVIDAIPAVDSTEPVAHVEVWAEAVEPAAEQVDAPVAETPGQNVVVLAEHRTEVGKRRGVIASTARWAATIALIATVAAVAAAGTGFAGHGELLIKSVCAVAGEGCSITLGMP